MGSPVLSRGGVLKSAKDAEGKLPSGPSHQLPSGGDVPSGGSTPPNEPK